MDTAQAKPTSTDGAFHLRREIAAPRDLVLRAHTDVEHLKHWWGPKGFEMLRCTIDLKPGGMFHYGMTAPDGGLMWGRWIFREISPERVSYVVSFSDEKGGITRHPMAPAWPAEMLCTSIFTAEGSKTVITSTAAPLNANAEERQVFEAGRESMTQGFAGTYDQLDAYLAKLCTPQPVIPYLTVRGAKQAIAYYEKAFGAVEQARMPAEDGMRLMHAAILINGGCVFMSDEFPEYGEDSAPQAGQVPPVAVALNLASPAAVDATFNQAVAAGGKGITEPRDEFWGARFAVVADPFGHRWLLNAALAK